VNFLKLKSKLSKALKKARNKYELPELFVRAQNFVKELSDSDKILILYHTDVDGYCSAALLISVLERIGIKNYETSGVVISDVETLMKTQRIKKFNKIIILDLDTPDIKQHLKNLGVNSLIIDHHMLRKNLNSKKLVYVNPRLRNEETYQPASYLVYKIFGSVIGIEDKEWIAVLGTVADFAFDDCKDLIEEHTTAKSKDDVPKTKFWRAGEMLYSAIMSTGEDSEQKLSPDNILKILDESENIEELTSNYKIKQAEDRFDKILEKHKQEFWKNSETFGNVVISTIRPSVKGVGSPIVTKLSIENKNKIIFLLEKRESGFKINARCQSCSLHMGELMRKCGNGGGHKGAAGGFIKVSELKKFKQCILKELKVKK